MKLVTLFTSEVFGECTGQTMRHKQTAAAPVKLSLFGSILSIELKTISAYLGLVGQALPGKDILSITVYQHCGFEGSLLTRSRTGPT